jgi:ABC-type Fe3+/spermidine/putrescine transport system ATPase subunit
MTTPALSVRGLTVRFGEVTVLDGLDLEVAAGETVALLGPSGSGKTTLLYAVAGLLRADAGTIEIDGTPMGADTGPERRSIGMVFQNYALWPHLSARRTVAYPLQRRGLSRGEAEAGAERLLALVGMGGLGDRLPDQLSGGQQQRVGLARALAAEPALYLFDEPTAHLDASVREGLQGELVAQRARTGAAAVYTTHDAAEAMAVADRVVVLRGGRIVQQGDPATVYARPIDAWTAALSGPVTLLRCRLLGAVDGAVEVEVGGVTISAAGGAACPPGDAHLVLRPDWVSLGGPLQGAVAAVRYDGPHTDYILETDAGSVRVRRPGPPSLAVGDRTSWSLLRAWVVAAGDGASPGLPTIDR